MFNQDIINYLLEGDVSIQYQVSRDLLDIINKDLQLRIDSEGWGKKFLSKQNPNGHWGDSFYQPKWISTHYTLLDLRNLNINPNNKIIKKTIELIIKSGKSKDGGIPLGPSTSIHSDICVNAMFLNYASYFNTKEIELESIVDCILNEIMPDGGFNCMSVRSGASHSSLHSTISVLEGLFEFIKSGNTYRKDEILITIKSAEDFILLHKLFKSDRTGEIIKKDFIKLTYPCRWKYDILRALDYFQYSNSKYDNRMDEAINILINKRNKDGYWNMQSAHPGQTHFIMEKAGFPSRWNTLRALRVLKHFDFF